MIEEIFRKTSFVDAILIFIVSVAIVSFWRGVWGLMDIFLFPNNLVVSYSITIIFVIFYIIDLSHKILAIWASAMIITWNIRP